MQTFINREALYDAYINTDEKVWEGVVGQYAKEGRDVEGKLYYLSIDPNLSGPYPLNSSFEDAIAMAGDFYYKELFTVTLPYRLLTSDTLQGAWNQIYGKLRHYFSHTMSLDSPMELYLYEVELPDCVVIDSDALTKQWLVHDAYMNGTTAVFGHPTLKLTEKLTVKNTFYYPDELCTYYYPFNDGKYMSLLLSTPLEIINREPISSVI